MIRFNAVSCIVLIGRVLIANCSTGSIVNAYLEGPVGYQFDNLVLHGY